MCERDYNYRRKHQIKAERRKKEISKMKFTPSLPYLKYDENGNEYISDGQKSAMKQYLKRQSNKKVRQYNDYIDDGGNYKKIFDLPWNWF